MRDRHRDKKGDERYRCNKFQECWRDGNKHNGDEINVHSWKEASEDPYNEAGKHGKKDFKKHFLSSFQLSPALTCFPHTPYFALHHPYICSLELNLPTKFRNLSYHFHFLSP